MTPKLLSEILNTTVTKVEVKDDVVRYNRIFKISTYKLMHLMKVWAFHKGYCLSSYYDEVGHGCEVTGLAQKPNTGLLLDIEEHSETKAVEKSCEWIMDNE